jgi:hypothetical protein
MKVNLGGFDRLVAQPQGNDGTVNTGLKQFHGSRVAPMSLET